MMTVVPTTSPQSADTERLVGTLRDEVAGTGIHVGGVTAAAVDTNEDMASRLPLLIGGVVGLSFLLLLTVSAAWPWRSRRRCSTCSRSPPRTGWWRWCCRAAGPAG